MIHSKVPKSQPITQLSNVFFTYCSIQIPPCSNGSIHFLHFLLCFAFFLLMTKAFVFVLNVRFNQTSRMHLHGLCPMHKTYLFSTMHGYCRVTKNKHPFHCIEIRMGTIRHEAFEVEFFIIHTFLKSLVREYHIRICESTSSDCMSHISIVNTLQYAMSKP